MRGNKRLYSIPKPPALRALRSPTSVKFVIYNKFNEQLCSFSRQSHFNYIAINYKRVKFWLKKGISFHPKNLIEVDRVLYPGRLSKNFYKLK